MDSIGSVYRGYDSWEEGMAAYRTAIQDNKLKVLPVIVLRPEVGGGAYKYC